MFKRITAPISVQWEVTPYCNYNCIHCYNYWQIRTDVKSVDIDFSLWDKIADELINQKIFSVIITGGEPLLVIDKLYSHISKLINAGIRISINSNVALLTNEMALHLKALGIKRFMVSLPCGDEHINDFITQTKGSFIKTIRGIKILVESSIPVTVNMVISEININYIKCTAKVLKDIGVKSFAVTKAATPSNCENFSKYRLSSEKFQKMLEDALDVKTEYGLEVSSSEFYPLCSYSRENLLTEFGTGLCSAAKTNITIGYDGLIRPCQHATHTYGHIDKSLNKAWNEMDIWRNNNLLPEKCNSCDKRFLCCGGCKVEAFLHSGSLSEPDPYCDFKHISPKMSTNIISLEISEEQIFSKSKELRFRKEDTGGIVLFSLKYWIFANEKLFSFLYSYNDFSALSFCSILDIPYEDGCRVIGYLLNKKIIYRKEAM